MKKRLLLAIIAVSLSAPAAATALVASPGLSAPAVVVMADATPASATPYAAQATPVFRYPEQNSLPRSELRVREISEPGAANAPVPVVDTPDSVAQYQRCQRSANREATSIADMQGRLAGCLSALDARRQAGQ